MPVLLRNNLNLGGSNSQSRFDSHRKLSPDANSNHVDVNPTLPKLSSRRTISIVSFAHSPEKSKSKTRIQRLQLLYKKLKLHLLVPLLFIILYMFIGSFLFLWFEASDELKRKTHKYGLFVRERELFLKRMEEIYLDQAAAEINLRKLFTAQAIDYFHEQIAVSFSNETEWSLATALYYSGTVFTTIGYGDVACNTVGGRIVTVVYAIIGIPLMLITLNDLGKFFYAAINCAVKIVGEKNSSLTKFLSKGTDKPIDVEVGENNTVAENNELKFQLSTDDTTITLDEKQVAPGPPPRMPVTVAIGTTVGWIFFCAALFKIWENDWTYAESCYFMFISLSTIGLGDVAVKRRDLMVICFVFVIIGLSLVSMCINVIQAALEDFYIRILMKILLDYQRKLAEGDNRMGASVGMMQSWSNNRAAKYLMPLLSKDRRMLAMAKVQEDAEANGLEVPLIFSDIDEKSGLPKIFAPSPDIKETVMEDLLREISVKAQSLESSSQRAPILYDGTTQTDTTICFEKMEQTILETSEKYTETEISQSSRSLNDVCVQTDSHEGIDMDTQTRAQPRNDQQTMTHNPEFTVMDIQTDIIPTVNEILQAECADYEENGIQTDLAECLNESVQTFPTQPEVTEDESQTDQIPVENERLTRRRSADPSVQVWDKIDELEDTNEEDEESSERLDWNPVDGMHAEKQKPVRALAKMFEIRSQNSLRSESLAQYRLKRNKSLSKEKSKSPRPGKEKQ